MSALTITIQALLANAAITAAVGQKVEPYPGDLKAAPPRIAVLLISENDGSHLSGADKYAASRVSMYCMATSATAANDIAEKVKGALDDFDRVIAGCYATMFKEGSDYTDFDYEAGIYWRTLDYLVHWKVV